MLLVETGKFYFEMEQYGNFSKYLAHIDNPQHRARTEEVLGWVVTKYIKWTINV